MWEPSTLSLLLSRAQQGRSHLCLTACHLSSGTGQKRAGRLGYAVANYVHTPTPVLVFLERVALPPAMAVSHSLSLLS